MWKAATATVADTTAKGAATVATLGLKAAVRGLIVTLKGFVMAHPFLVAAAAIAATVAIVDALTVSYSENKEKLQELHQETQSLKSELESLSSELKTTQDRIEELQSKGPLTFVEQEELNKLKEQNAELERSIQLKKNEIKISERKENKQFLDTANQRETESVTPSAYVTRDRMAEVNIDNYRKNADAVKDLETQLLDAQSKRDSAQDDATKTYYDGIISDLDSRLEKARKEKEASEERAGKSYQEILELMSGRSRIENPTEQWERDYNEKYDKYQALLDLYNIIVNGDGAKTLAFNRISALPEFDETKKELEELGKSGKVTADILNQTKYSKFIAECQAAGISIEDLVGYFDDMQTAPTLDDKGANSLKTALAGLSDETTVLRNAMGKLGEAQPLPLSADAQANIEQYTKDIAAYRKELEEASKLGVDPGKTVFGNVDLGDPERIIRWTDETLEKYKDALMGMWTYEGWSWDEIKDDLRGGVSTVLGGLNEGFEVPIAVTPVVKIDDEWGVISDKQLSEYIGALVDKASADGSWTDEELFRLDAEGIEMDGKVIKNVIADIGKTAKKTSETMHFAGPNGALAGAADGIKQAEAAISSLKSTAKMDDSVFMDWLKGADGNWDNLKSLLDKFPDLKDELEAYTAAIANGANPQMEFERLQRAMNAALQDFNTDKFCDGVQDVIDAFNDYGPGSNQVLQAVQNLDKYIPGLTNQLYGQDNAFSKLSGTTELTAEAFYEYCAAAIEAERTSREIDISNLTTDLTDLAAMAMTAGHSMKEAMGLAKDEAYNRSGESFGTDDSMAKLTEWYETSMANLEGARNKWRRSQSPKKGKDVYVPDVDPLYQYLQAVEDINDQLDRLDIDEKLLDEDDFEGKNALIEARIQKLEELKTALHKLNNARDVEINTAVGKLNGYGDFQATYDAESGQALINNMDALKNLTGDTAREAEALISTIEDGSKAAVSASKEWMEAEVEKRDLLKEQRELREGASDDRIERHRNAISLLQNQQGVAEGNLDYQAAVNSLKEQKAHWVEIQNIAHQMAEDIRAAHPGITNDDPMLKRWIDTWWEANGEIKTANEKFVEDSLARLDSFIQQADNFNWWDNIDTTKVDMLEKKLETIHQLYADGIIPDAATYKKLVDETAKEIYDEKLNAIEQVIDYTKKLIEEEVRLRKEELEEQVDDYKKIVDLKKESLRASKDEADYQKSVAEKTKAIAQLQQQINTLALSDDRRDIAERKKLEEELAELQGELADTQADHTLETQEKALDDSYDAFEKEKNDEVKKLEATIDTEGKLYALAIQRIDDDWDALYRDLRKMNSLYWDGIAGEAGIKGAWDTAKQAAEGYKGTLETIQGIEKERAAVSGTGTSVGSSAVSDKNAAYLTGDIDKQKQLQAIGAEMQTNSQMWHTAYNANNKGQMEALQKANQRLANKVKELTGQAPVFDSRDGYWKLANGEHFYEVYHGGTKSAGSDEPWDLKSDEIMAKLKREEAVIPKDQVKPTLKFLEWGNSLASKAKGLFSGGRLVSSAMSDAIKGAPLSPATGAIVNNNAPSFAPNINVEVKY